MLKLTNWRRLPFLIPHGCFMPKSENPHNTSQSYHRISPLPQQNTRCNRQYSNQNSGSEENRWDSTDKCVLAFSAGLFFLSLQLLYVTQQKKERISPSIQQSLLKNATLLEIKAKHAEGITNTLKKRQRIKQL